MKRNNAAICLLCAALLLARAAVADELHDATFAVPAFSLSFSLHYLADDLHLWEKHGIRMKSVMIAGVGSANAVISGSADAAYASPPTVTRAAAHDQRLVAIAALQDRLFLELVLRKDLAAGFDPKAPLAERAKFLKGRTIAVDSINSIIHAYVMLVAHRGGLAPDDLRIAPMAPPAMLAAFDAGQIDGFDMSLPWPLVPALAGKAVVIANGTDGDPPDMVPFANTLVVVRDGACEKREWLCVGIGGAMSDAARYVHDHPDEALALLQKRFPTLDPKLVATAFQSMINVTPVPPASGVAELANAERLNIEAGLLKPEEKLSSYDGLATDKYVH